MIKSYNKCVLLGITQNFEICARVYHSLKLGSCHPDMKFSHCRIFERMKLSLCEPLILEHHSFTTGMVGSIFNIFFNETGDVDCIVNIKIDM